MNDKIKKLLKNAEQSDAIARNKWRIENREQLRKERKEKLKELMEKDKQQTAVDSIIEFCQKQMDNDSSIHKGVYLSIIKFCKEQITEESEIHWKTTLVTMTNNKQQTAVEWFGNESWQLKVQLDNQEISVDEYAVFYIRLLYKAKAMHKEEIINSFFEGAYGGDNISGEQYYNETFKGGEQ